MTTLPTTSERRTLIADPGGAKYCYIERRSIVFFRLERTDRRHDYETAKKVTDAFVDD